MKSFITLEAKALFFDSAKIRQAVSKANRANLSKAGAFVRTAASRSIRPRPRMKPDELSPEQRLIFAKRVRNAKRRGLAPPKLPMRPSLPGQPPADQTKVLKRTILFGYDEASKSVVVGPILRSSSKGTGTGVPVPLVLEVGGKTRSFDGSSGMVKARPFMKPALDSEMPKFPDLWRNSLTRF